MSFRCILEYEAHHRIIVSLVFGALAFCLGLRWLPLPVNLIVSWDIFAFTSLVLAWIGMIFSDARSRVQEARLQDSHRTVIAGCVVLAAIAGLFGAWLLLGSAKELQGGKASFHFALAAFTVLISWMLVHTVMALHYTHVCYLLAGKSRAKSPNIGVVFPNEPHPDFIDFAYFSFVIGMTCQVSDVQITSRSVRRLALLHGLLSFGYNTVIVAMSLNMVASLL